MAFNQDLSLYQNVKLGLLVSGKSFDTAAEDIGAKPESIKQRLHNRLIREGKSTPLDKKIYEYLKKNCNGFHTYCRANNIKIVS
jgi:hypothetical protein